MDGKFWIYFFGTVYLIAILFIGIYATRKTKTIQDYLIAGGRMGVWVLSLGLMAAVQSGWTWMGLPGGVSQLGYAHYIMIMGVSWFGMGLGHIILAKPMKLISVLHGSLTLPDILALRFDESNFIRGFSAIIVAIGASAYLLAQWAAVGWIMSTLFDIPFVWGVIIGCSVIGVYTIRGGIFASMWTNFVQMIIMLITTVVLLIVGFSYISLPELNLWLGNYNPDFLQPWAVPGHLITISIPYMLGIAILTFGAAPQVCMKYLTAKNINALRYSGIFTTFIFYFGSLAFFLGLIGTYLVQTGQIAAPVAPDQMLPHLAVSLMPPFIAGILMASILAAVMSTAESFLILASSAIVRDLFQKTLKRNISPHQELLWLRIITGVVLVVTIVLSFDPPLLISFLGALAWGIFSASFGPALYFGLRWKRATKEAAIASMVIGFAFAGGLQLYNTFGRILDLAPFMPHWHWGGVGSIIAFVVMIVVSLITPYKESQLFAHFKSAKS